MYTFHVKAPCEAEASCAALVKSGKVYATATEDMDGLTFGTTVLLRHLTASEAKYVWIRFISEIVFVFVMEMENVWACTNKWFSLFFHFRKLPVQEFHFNRILQDMGLTHQQVRPLLSVHPLLYICRSVSSF